MHVGLDTSVGPRLGHRRQFASDAVAVALAPEAVAKGDRLGLQLEVGETVPSPATAYYRNKVQFPVCDRDGKLTIGMYARRTHEVVSADTCLLQPPLLGEIAAYACETLDLQGVRAYDEIKHKGLLRHLFLRRSGSTCGAPAGGCAPGDRSGAGARRGTGSAPVSVP